MKNHLKNNRGAASIIVIFMIMVLFVFGMLALTTAIANQRLSTKSAYWVKDFYALEYRAEELLFDIDALLEGAEAKARKHVYSDLTDGGLPRPGVDYGDQLARYYYFFACEALATLSSDVMEDYNLNAAEYTDLAADMAQVPLPVVYLDVADENTNKHILVSVQAIYSQYDISEAQDGRIVFTRSDALQPRYEIVEWREWQEPFDYNNPVQWWDGSLT